MANEIVVSTNLELSRFDTFADINYKFLSKQDTNQVFMSVFIISLPVYDIKLEICAKC